MAHPGNAVVVGILEYSCLLMSIYMVVIHRVSLDYTIYMLGVVAIEVSHLIGTCLCSLFKTRHNRSKQAQVFQMLINVNINYIFHNTVTVGKIFESVNIKHASIGLVQAW